MKEKAKRLTPTPETIRRLFLLSGNQCAFQGCVHPIITEEGTYVGEICHICAAEEEGERFDPVQTNEDRRQFDNLLLMCHDHHVITNDVAEYSVERMRQLKADHESRFMRGLADIMESADIQIVNSNIALGGEGGKAPGAGGGGGGALGPGAIGGIGGDGGKSVHFQLDIEDLNKLKKRGFDRFEIKIGQGGDSGNHGEDSIVNFVTADGSVLESVAAMGGRSGVHHTADNGTREAEEVDIKAGLRISTIMLSEVIQLRQGLLFLLGAGWTTYQCASLPFEAYWPLVFSIDLSSVKYGEAIKFHIVVKNPSGSSVLDESFVVPRGSTDQIHRPNLFQMLSFTGYQLGIWTIEIISGQQVLVTHPVEIQGPPGSVSESL